MEYIGDFLNSYSDDDITWENLKPLPPSAFTYESRQFATEVYRVFCDGAAFDAGSPIDFNQLNMDDTNQLTFLLQVWAAFSYPDEAAFRANWIKNILLLHYYCAGKHKSLRDVVHFTDIDDVYELRRLYFVEYAVEAVADCWQGTPLRKDEVKRIANGAMEYSVKKADMMLMYI
jgi:hypothetical protein